MGEKTFVSYASEDHDFVVGEVVPLFDRLGVSTWLAGYEIKPGKDFDAEIRKALPLCSSFLVVVSESSVRSKWVKAEVVLASEHFDDLVCLVVDESNPAELYTPLTISQHISWNDDSDHLSEQLGRAFSSSERMSPAPGTVEQSEPARLVSRLRTLRDSPRVDEVPFLLECLSHDVDSIRERAMQVIVKLGWHAVAGEVERVSEFDDQSTMEAVLRGLKSIKATESTVALLVRLCELLHGDLRRKALKIAEHKRLSLQFDRISDLFSERSQNYELIEPLGAGLFAASYLARHKQTRQRLVVRVLRPELALQPEVRVAFIDLANRSAHYVHHALALTRDVNQFPDCSTFYCVRDYIDGMLLQRLIDEHQVLEPANVSDILCQIVKALKAVHVQGHCHGGVKPSNIYLLEGDRIVVGDPSLPASLMPPALDRVVYDYRYAAPECFDRHTELTEATDLYALACVGYELLVGAAPFESDDPFEIAHLHKAGDVPPPSARNPRLGESADRALLPCLKKDPADRPAMPDGAIALFKALARGADTGAAASIYDPAILAQENTVIRFPEHKGYDTDHTVVKVRPPKSRPSAGDPAPEIAPDALVVSAPDFDISDPDAMKAAAAGWPAEVPGGSRDMIEFAEGYLLRGRFKFEKKLGEGGMGAVWQGIDELKVAARSRNPQVAIKILQGDFKMHPESFIALQREAEKQQRLAHPNIATVYDFDRDLETGAVFMTMEVLNGQDLASEIRNLPRDGLSLEEAMPYIMDLCEGLKYAHAHGLVHSDLKPGNCFVTQSTGLDGEITKTVKLLDFGIARASKTKADASGETSLFDPGELGALTPTYATVEMFEGMDPDPRDDIYALAIMTYQLLTGKHPYNKQSAPKAMVAKLEPALLPGLTKRQNKALRKGLEFLRENRTETVEEFLDGIAPKESHTVRWVAGGVGVAAILAVLLINPVKNWIWENRTQPEYAQRVVECIQVSDSQCIAEVMTEVEQQYTDRYGSFKELDEIKNPIIGFYEAQLPNFWDPTNKRYEYAMAVAKLAELTTANFYPDSAKVHTFINETRESKIQTLRTLSDEYAGLLEEGMLIPQDDVDDISDVLSIVKQIDPNNELLNDAALPIKYADFVEAAIADEKWNIAKAYLDASKVYTPDDPRLNHLRETVDAHLVH